MNALMNCMKETIRATDLTVALQDCLYSWDGEIDFDVIVGGIGDRLAAMGTPVESVSITRESLDMVTIEAGSCSFTCVRNSVSDYSLRSIEWTGEDDVRYAVFAMSTNVQKWFTESELRRICEWITNNFYYM